MQRYFRHAATIWSHLGPTMAEPLARRVGRDRLGLPSDYIADSLISILRPLGLSTS